MGGSKVMGEHTQYGEETRAGVDCSAECGEV